MTKREFTLRTPEEQEAWCDGFENCLEELAVEAERVRRGRELDSSVAGALARLIEVYAGSTPDRITALRQRLALIEITRDP